MSSFSSVCLRIKPYRQLKNTVSQFGDKNSRCWMFSSLAGSLLEPEGIRQRLNGLLTMNYKSKCLPGGFPNKQTPRLGLLSDGRCKNWKGLNQIKCKVCFGFNRSPGRSLVLSVWYLLKQSVTVMI